MANTGFKGIDVRQTGNQLVFRAFLQTSAGALLSTGTTTLSIVELQSDGTVKTYDFNDNTFKATACTTATLAMTHRPSNNAATTTGFWTAILATLTGFTVGAMYIAFVNNTGASPTDQAREFEYGSAEGDLVVTGGLMQSNAAQVGGAATTLGLTGSTLTLNGTAIAIVDPAGVTTLLNRLTSTRAGYIDNLNVGGLVASAAAVLNIQNNTFIASDVPYTMERPDAGSETVPITFIFCDDTGAAKDLDSGNPALTLTNNAGTDLSSRLAGSGATWTHVGTGEYKIVYTNTSTDVIAELVWKVTGTINAVARKMVYRTQLVDTTAVDFTSSDRTDLQTILARADVATSTRLATSGYTTPPTASQNASATRVEMDVSSTQFHAIVQTQASQGLSLAALSVTLGDVQNAVDNDMPTPTEVATAVWGATADTIPYAKLMEIMLAVLAGKATVSAGVVTYMRRDGTTASVRVAFDAAGNRTASTLP